ncbi:hypothetical protein AP064_03765 [Candidatus Liberibacter solanacearum]|uniref:Uncharacterized protein n=1 Tax=Candidatus Liberibacter solanacearum TaxID=556287 RepID=A0A0F4VJK7_9HYPH|nr:N-6 DNA methylase [Candidatus Liberibacter solanacearum]KJZ81626.1 hypothetical protein DJ66_0348 [Candidatus Liberibacter solanacearum]KQC48911.1 hypothetical protein AP064_03765 [Candidatus Liberibacter solanacearum]
MLDIISNREIKETPEEIVRQEYIKVLINDYGYKVEDITLEYSVKKSPSDTRRSLPVDIAIKENGTSKIFVETKKPEYQEGFIQLKNYMDFESDVTWGVWTNGSDTRYIKKIIKNGKIDYIERNNIPKKYFADVSEQIKKKDLITATNLRIIFRRIRAYLASSEVGTTRDENIAKEIINVVLCKVYIEKFTPSDEYYEFYANQDDDKKTAQRIKHIFEQVKNKYDEVFSFRDEITLTNQSLAYIVSQLQIYSLTDSSRNVLSDAFESIVGYSLKGEKGQFFTPKNIIKLMVHLIKPQKQHKIIDPACGSGGFLIESMLYVWENISNIGISDLAKQEDQRDYAMKKIFGIEKDDFLAKFCKAYMAVIGDGKSGIKILNSLSTPKMLEQHDINLASFDLVLTNPPFGKEISIENDLKSQYCSSKVDVAFLQRALDLVKPKGILGIILSEVVFHAPTYKKFRDLFFKNNKILSIIDLPHDTFRPFNNAKCVALILQKEKNSNHKNLIKMINLKEIGHTPQGNIKYIFDYDKNIITDELADDVPSVIKLLEENNFNNHFIKEIEQKRVIDEDVYIPRYYFELSKPNKENFITIENLISENILESFEGHGSPSSHFKGKGEYPYVRVKDIVNLEININEMDSIPEFEYIRLKWKERKLREKDIVFVRRGSYRIGDVGFVYKKDINSIYTKELQFFRIVDEKNKYYITKNNLLSLLRSKEVREQLENLIFMDTTLPTIYKRWLKIKLPLYNEQDMELLDKKMSSAYNKRQEFWDILNRSD